MIRGETRGVAVVEESQVYRDGWTDGRFGYPDRFAANGAQRPETERLAYRRGYREGRRVREMLGLRA